MGFPPNYKAIPRTAFDKRAIKNSVKFKCIESTPIEMFYDSGWITGFTVCSCRIDCSSDISTCDINQQIVATILRRKCAIESLHDFLIKLDMKPWMHLVKISIFSLNHVIIRLTKVMNNSIEHLKIGTFNVIFLCQNWSNLSKKKFYEKPSTRRPTFIK